MTARLQRVHALLREGNVPCALGSRPGLGVVLHAGTPDSGTWDVLVRDSEGRLVIHDAMGATTLPAGLTDAAITDTVKLHVIQAWADQGDPDAKAVIATLNYRARASRSTDGRPATASVDVLTIATLLDPLLFFERMVDSGTRFASALLTGSPASVAYSMWSPWGTVRGGYTRR